MWPKIKAGIDAINTKLKQDVADIWNQDKAFFFVFGIVILIVKFRDFWIDLLINSAKNVQKTTEKKDAGLATQEGQENRQADALVQQAQQEPSKEQPVTDDWYKKDN